MTTIYPAFCLAAEGFSGILSCPWQNTNLISFIVTAVAGALLTLLFFIHYKRGPMYRAIAWISLSATLLLLFAQVFAIRALIYGVFLALLIIMFAFQQELREIFVSVFGGGAISGKKQVAVVDLHHSVIDAVCQATAEMARSHTGALIVLERHIKLDDIARSGVELDAKVSPYLIRNVFYDKAPLHDGAMIIRNCRVWAASCILPLSSRSDINQDLGTRHRAALGLSEICDAVVIVVSEETGLISIAYHSELVQDYSFQSLHAFLVKNLLHESEENGQDE